MLRARASLIGAGVGRFLTRKLADRISRPYVDFSSLIPGSCSAPDTADCAPAAAVAALALGATALSRGPR
jgi:(4-(4-[2-(gamma-L-glutamylamino)ethyl]phenoxymethyl)furan-2-yl)methanamine synthase